MGTAERLAEVAAQRQEACKQNPKACQLSPETKGLLKYGLNSFKEFLLNPAKSFTKSVEMVQEQLSEHQEQMDETNFVMSMLAPEIQAASMAAEILPTWGLAQLGRFQNLIKSTPKTYRPGEVMPNMLIAGEAPGAALANSSEFSRWTESLTPWQRTVYQRADINWNFIRPEGTSLAGKTNWEASTQGYAPVRINPETGRIDDVILHHLNQDPRGSVAEVWRSTHGKVPHEMDPPGAWRKLRPDWAEAWSREQSAYWRWRTGEYNPAPINKLKLPGDN